MAKTILIFANCVNSTAKGDFSLAGNIAKDLAREIGSGDINVVLTSTLSDIARYEALYGKAVDGRLIIEGQSIGLCALEQFNAVENKVIAFIEANRCKYASADLVKRVLSPDSKFLFVGAANKRAVTDQYIKYWMYLHYSKQQHDLYEHFDESDVLIGASGLGDNRLGLPSIKKAEDLPELGIEAIKLIPSVDYGFMYLSAIDATKAQEMIAQYVRLSGGMTEYVLVGQFAALSYDINKEIRYDMILNGDSDLKPLPKIHYHQSLDNRVMRKVAAGSSGKLVVSTGVMSTLEAMHDNKVTYYQDLSCNTNFVESYLLAVKSICSSDASFGCMPQLIIELSNLLLRINH